MEKQVYRKAIIGRLPLYLRFLSTINRDPKSYISATRIAKEIGLGEVLVRKDLNHISGHGRPKVGYRISTLKKDLEAALDINDKIKAVIVGAGNLGMALYKYPGYQDFGIEVVAAFDIDSNKVKRYSKYKVLPYVELKPYVKENKIKVGIITVPAYSAQFACDQLVKAGIKAIWNFSSKELAVPNHVVVKNEDLALSLAYLKNNILNK